MIPRDTDKGEREGRKIIHKNNSYQASYWSLNPQVNSGKQGIIQILELSHLRSEEIEVFICQLWQTMTNGSHCLRAVPV